MTDDTNPLGRKYNDVEVAAARRLGIKGTRSSLGALAYAAGPYWPKHARDMARDWAIVANALDREWTRDRDGKLPDGTDLNDLDGEVGTFQRPGNEVEETVLGGPAGVLGYLYQCANCRWSATDPNPTAVGACPMRDGRMSRQSTDTP